MSEKTSTEPSIPEVFSGKSVFITGATGFVGKVLLEKLLRSCPGITEVVVLINEVFLENVFQEKKAKLLKSSVFYRIQNECPGVMEKVRFVAGDVTAVCLGLKSEEEIKIKNQVSFVFHCAANVRFEDTARNTLGINVLGVDRVAKFCMGIKKLEALVHVSTAYSFCHHPLITEEMHPEKLPACVMRSFRDMDDEQLEWICDSYRKTRPSNYQYSKALAETLIKKEYSNCLPIVIVRPAIITGAAWEPYPGWVDNYNGPSGFIAMSSKGVLKTLLVRKGVNADWVPVDLVANTLIVAAYFISLNNASDLLTRKIPIWATALGEIPIINCVCPAERLLSWNEVSDICLPLIKEYPCESVYSVPGGVVTSSEIIHTVCKYIFHFFPAILIDIYQFATTGRTRMVKNYRRIHGVMNHMQLYTTRRFRFTSENMSAMIKNMHPSDTEVFRIDQKKLQWNKYMRSYVRGVRRYFLKERDNSLPAARRNLRRIETLLLFFKLIPVGLGLAYIMRKYGRQGFEFKLPSELHIPVLSSIKFQKNDLYM